jgi:hypothetical protein
MVVYPPITPLKIPDPQQHPALKNLNHEMERLCNIERTHIVPASVYSWLRIVDGAGNRVTIGIFKTEGVASAPSELVSSPIDLEITTVVQARILATRTEICVVTSALAVNPNGMIFMTVDLEMRLAVVESGGTSGLGHDSAEEGDGCGGELHFAVVFEMNLKNSIEKEELCMILLQSI